MNKLSIVMGLPCSGKTTFTSSLDGIRLNLDEIRKSLTGTYRIDNKFNSLIYNVSQDSTRFYLQNGYDLVLDGVFLSKASRAPYIKIAKQYDAEIELFWLNPSLEWIRKTLIERNQWAEADRQFTFSYIQSLSQQKLEIPTKSEGFTKMYQITEKDFLI